MSRFHSTAKREVSFELGGYKHTLAPGDELDVPAKLAYLVAARGLPLAAGPSPVDGAKPARSERAAPAPPPPAVRESVPDERDDVDGEADPEPAAVDDGAGADSDATNAAIEQAATAAGLPPARARRRGAQG